MEKFGIIIMVIALLLVGGLIGWYIGATKYHGLLYEYWTNDCRVDGGTVQSTTTSRVECFKDGQIINHVY